MALTDQRCEPCEGGVPPMGRKEAERLLQQVPGWALDEDSIHRDLRFADFRTAMGFLQAVGELAESEGHHPDLLLHGYRNVRITLSTHAIGGLSKNDFILAAKVDPIAQRFA